MGLDHMQKLVKKHCKLYKGGETNPYSETCDTSVSEYLKFQIWDAECSAVKGYTQWYDSWKSKNPIITLTKEDAAETIYKLAVRTKLKKMQDGSDVDFMSMYFEL